MKNNNEAKIKAIYIDKINELEKIINDQKNYINGQINDKEEKSKILDEKENSRLNEENTKLKVFTQKKIKRIYASKLFNLTKKKTKNKRYEKLFKQITGLLN